MMRDCEPPLVFLWHPGTHDRFSDYGLRIAPAHLVGVVMIDRPMPAASTWLEEIHQTFGGYDMVTMTRDGTRGIACQMRLLRRAGYTCGSSGILRVRDSNCLATAPERTTSGDIGHGLG